MKSCPTCKRTFEDTLTYCLVDGSILSAPFDPQATLLIPQQTPTVPMGNPAIRPNRTPWIIGAGVTLVIAATIIVIALVNRSTDSGERASNISQQDRAKASESNVNNRNENSPSSVPGKEAGNNNSIVMPSETLPPTNDGGPSSGGIGSGSGTGARDLHYLQKYAGEYVPDMFKKEEGLKQRLAALLGANYQSFMERWDVTGPIEEDGAILFAEGCMAHSCGSEESLLAIDTANGIIYCAVLSDSFMGRFRTFGEQNGSFPAVMKKKMQELAGTK